MEDPPAQTTEAAFACSTFFRMGSQFVRALTVILPILRDHVDFHMGSPPEHACLSGKELMDFAVTNFCYFYHSKGHSPESRARREQSIAAYKKDWENHLNLWNGSFAERKRIAVYTYNVDLSPESKEAYLRKMTKSFIKTAMRRIPCKAEHGKWTKFTPALEFQVVANEMHGMLEKILKTSGNQVDATVKLGGKDGGEQHLTWHQQLGKSYASTLEAAGNKGLRIGQLIMSICMEPHKMLQAFFLKCSSSKREGRSYALDLLNENYSPLTLAYQELHTLACGKSQRWVMLYRSLGYSSMLDLCRSEEDGKFGVLACTFARMLSASVWMRVEKVISTQPLPAAMLVDGRISAETRLELASDTLGMQPCCRGLFLQRLLTTKGTLPLPRAEELLEPLWQRRLQGWVVALDTSLSVANLERKNRRNKTVITEPNMHFDNFSAISMLRELQTNAQDAEELGTAKICQRSPNM